MLFEVEEVAARRMEAGSWPPPDSFRLIARIAAGQFEETWPLCCTLPNAAANHFLGVGNMLTRLVTIVLLTASLARADVIYGTSSDGYQYGTDGTHGLLISPTGDRFVYLDRQVFLTRGHDVICVRWNDFHEECVYRYDADLDRMATNFDIDPYFTALISGQPNAGGFVYTNADNDAFVAWLFTDRHP